MEVEVDLEVDQWVDMGVADFVDLNQGEGDMEEVQEGVIIKIKFYY